MKVKTLVKHLMVVAVLALAIGQAQAATTYTLNLSGDVSQAYTDSSDSNGTHLDNFSLYLSGLVPFTAYKGDTVNATIQLNGSVTIPASVNSTWVYLSLFGNNNSGFDTMTNATTNIYNGSTLVRSATTTLHTSDWLNAGAVLYPVDDTKAFTFDKITISYTIEELGTNPSDSLNLTDAMLSAQGQSPAAVPAPAPLLLLGSGLLGLAGFRKKLEK
jgi:hypothetical protein